ncbi:hypothetical protein Hypma_006842 [Hypsizygus marmoreus]|uniref:Uncharacterized protein n=1 Tax=Hypsizygus marmoreus TaxID=39966 RepID=A0A369K5N6_HYPMA|nr:hypothetical protein Hypma_006842 [Hypsizygus marmoreus]
MRILGRFLRLFGPLFGHLFYLLTETRNMLCKTNLDNIAGLTSRSCLKAIQPHSNNFTKSLCHDGRVVGISGPFANRQLYVFNRRPCTNLHNIQSRISTFLKKVMPFCLQCRLIISLLAKDFSPHSAKNTVNIERWFSYFTQARPYRESVKELTPALFAFPTLHFTYFQSSPKLRTPNFTGFTDFTGFTGSTGFTGFMDWMSWKNIIDVMAMTAVEIFKTRKLALEAGNEAILKQLGQGMDVISFLSEHGGVER